MSTVFTILSDLQQDIGDLLESSQGKITCKVNSEIVRLVQKSGLEQAARNISDADLKKLAVILDKNIKNMVTATQSLTCNIKGGKKRSKKGGADSKFAIFLDGTTNIESKGGTGKGRSGRSTRGTASVNSRRRGSRQEPEEESSDEEDDEAGVNQTPITPPISPQYSPTNPPSSGQQVPPSRSQYAMGSRVVGDPMPTNPGIAQDMFANLDGYELLGFFYLVLINVVLAGTGAYTAAINFVAGGVGEGIFDLPNIESVCGIVNREIRNQGANFINPTMECQEAQNRWNQIVASLGILTFLILAILSARGARRIDTSASTRGGIAMSYELGMSGVANVSDVLRGYPKGATPPRNDTRSPAAQILAAPIQSLANLASSLYNSAASLSFYTPPQESGQSGQQQPPIPGQLALQDITRTPPVVTPADRQSQELTPPPPSQTPMGTSSGRTLGSPSDAVPATDRETIRARRVALLSSQSGTRPRSDSVDSNASNVSELTEDSSKNGGRKKRSTRKRGHKKGKKSKKSRKTRRKAPKKTRKVNKNKNKKGKKAKKARKTRRR
ncbi:MAG: hypothetical protein CMB96_04815 [Flavobacteriaceae bacterium]|nr:hypothetical protein [Flavobacteriaceae bacterium]